jgi:valyl-tRNA synthetase
MIPKAYEPRAVEEKWYEFWLKQNCFVADAHSSKPAYSIVIPPPNVTGMLHLGHVLNNTIPGHPLAQSTHGRQRSALVAGD